MIDFALTPPIIATYMLSNIFLVYITFRLYCVYFTRTQVNKRLEFFCFAVFYLLNTLACLLLKTPIFNLLTTVVPLVGIAFLYPERLQKKLLVSLGCYALMMASDMMMSFIFRAIGLPSWQRFVLIGPSEGLIMLTFALVMQKHAQPKSNGQLAFLHWLAIFLVPVGSIAVMVLVYYNSLTTPIPVLLVTIIQLFINVLVFYLFDALGKYYADRSEKQFLEQQNHAYREEFALMRQAEQQVRTLRHDMKNHLSILRQYADDGRKAELDKYLEEFAEKLTHKTGYVHTGNPDLDSILNYKLGQAEAAGAKLAVDVSLPEQLEVDVFDLNVVLGNLLDNAIEGMANATDKQMNLSLHLDRGVLFIHVDNTYDGVVNIEHTANTLRYRTRKKDGALHGLGLESIKATINKYHGYLEINHQDKLFVVEAMLYLLEVKQ